MAHAGRPDRPTRLWCVLASLASDLDGLSLLFGRDAYADYHHLLLHNLPVGVLVTAVSARWVGVRPAPLALVFAAFLSHLVGDYFGSGPGWPLWPYRPFLGTMYLREGAWQLVSWQNTTITAAAIAITLWIAATRGYTPLEFLHRAADRTVVDALQLRARATTCRWCAARAYFRCHGCREAACEAHVSRASRLRPRCVSCADAAATAGAPP